MSKRPPHALRHGTDRTPCFRVEQAAGSLVTLAAILGLVGCAPPIDGTRPSFPFAKGWGTRISGASRVMDDRAWWQGLKDPTLDALISRALSGSPDLTAARARAAAAQQAAAAVPGAFSVTGGVGGTETRGDLSSYDTQMTADMGVELLLDPGRGRQARQAGARAEAASAEAELAAARLLLIGEVADTYLTLRHGQKRLALARAEADRQRKTLDLAQKLMAGGQGTKIDILRSEARLASLQATTPGLEAGIAQQVVSLAVLVGDAPGSLPADLMSDLQQAGQQPRASLPPDPGVPADLIRNRPDLRLAEARYDAARAALGQARAQLYPSLSLSGMVEVVHTRTGTHGSTGNLAQFGPSLRLPALPGGATQAGVDAATQGVVAAHADWTAAVLKALGEVETGLLSYRSAVATEAAAEKAVRLHAETREMTSKATGLGEATLSDLIAVEDALSEAETVRCDARLARAQAFVQLNLRLGSGA